MKLISDMGGFSQAGVPVIVNPRTGFPFGLFWRRDELFPGGGETIILLSQPPYSCTLQIFDNGSLISSANYTVAADGLSVTLASGLTNGHTVTVLYASIFRPTASTLVPTPTDPLFAYVQALLHFEGANLSTTFTDVTGRTWTPGNGANITTTAAKFGLASGDFTPTHAYIYTADDAALRPGTGDFCIEWQMFYNDHSAYQTIIAKGYTSSGDLLVQTDGVTGRLILYLSGTAVATETGGALSDAQWYGCRVRRSGTAVSIERDGVVVATGTSSANVNSTATLSIGSRDSGGLGGNYGINGVIDDFRYTVGNARGANVVQTAPWPDHA